MSDGQTSLSHPHISRLITSLDQREASASHKMRAVLTRKRSTFLSQRLSSLAIATDEQAKIPTRHSRHSPPPACVDREALHEMTSEIVESRPGSLFCYDSSLAAPSNDRSHAWDVCNTVVQKVEWLVGGHSSFVANTIQQKVQQTEGDGDELDRINAIESLIDRVEEEGELYMKLRQQVLASKTDDEDAESMLTFTFAAPGPTVAMYDTLLDTLAQTSETENPEKAANVLDSVIARFKKDGGLERNSNPYTVPTAISYNGVLRAIANTPNASERTRDSALTHAFETFSNFSEAPIPPNSGTYLYMIQILERFVPNSETRDNILNGMWTLAKNDQVVDGRIMETMETIELTNVENLDPFVRSSREGDSDYVIPLQWRKFARTRRHSETDDTY